MLFIVDGLYLTARSLGLILANEGAEQLTNGALFHTYASNTQFNGVSGHVVLNVRACVCAANSCNHYLNLGNMGGHGVLAHTPANSDRLPALSINQVDKAGSTYPVVTIDVNNVTQAIVCA